MVMEQKSFQAQKTRRRQEFSYQPIDLGNLGMLQRNERPFIPGHLPGALADPEFSELTP
jgi:hypothetical protein